MIDEATINSNKEEYLRLLKTINRDGAKLEELIEYLESTDFFIAPASVKYHNNFKGGLVDHSLNVYYNLLHLFNYVYKDTWENFDVDTITITALCHDFDKINKYKTYVQNKKFYCEDGDKQDELGKFTWVSELNWTYNDSGSHLTYGNHEMNSEFIARQFIPLRIEESVAILHHMGTLGSDSAKDNISQIYSNYPIALLLHEADMLATFINEVKQE